ncbi:unnamed protein product [Mycena citricolor]|uniref:Uncharacterized protein n=1 Tax=Mycena citricolor TaxID=2018698 RepID=A0AAD2Q3K4_9AGAR|nr:unnamed protein product [Mycena citricolor]
MSALISMPCLALTVVYDDRSSLCVLCGASKQHCHDRWARRTTAHVTCRWILRFRGEYV